MRPLSKEILSTGITEAELNTLDLLFESFSVVSEMNYIYVCDMKHDVSRWSLSAIDFFGLPGEYMVGAGEIWRNCIHPDDRKEYETAIAEIFSGKTERHDLQYRAKDRQGNYVVCTSRGMAIKDSQGNPLYFGGALKKHGIGGIIDPMTGLKNQYAFFEDVQRVIEEKKETNVTLIGIGKFTEINEMHGYEFGNMVIQKFGRYLHDIISRVGNVYRMDGAKFAITSHELDTDKIVEYYGLLQNHFRRELEIDGTKVVLDLNAGTLNLNSFDVNVQTLYSCLNFAYGESKIKRQGDMVVFYNTISDENQERVKRFYYIRNSITDDCKGFFLLYQPIVDAQTEKLIGAEALLRWKNDHYGMVPPDLFIPILERDPLFPELGRWILKNALLGAKPILEKYPDFVLNVNLSYVQLEKPDFVDMVLSILDETEYPPENLCLEITERCRLLDMSLLKTIIAKLKPSRIRFALDDFGTGYSAVGIIKQLPFDTIKIDRSFVSHIESDEKERQLVNHFTGIAGTFGAKVCVEGVETNEMRDILQTFSVNSFQGYLYSKPIEPKAILELFDYCKKF